MNSKMYLNIFKLELRFHFLGQLLYMFKKVPRKFHQTLLLHLLFLGKVIALQSAEKKATNFYFADTRKNVFEG